jgi:hypothetical protein
MYREHILTLTAQNSAVRFIASRRNGLMPFRIKNSVILTSPESAAHSSGVCPSLSGAAMSSCAMWAPWELLQQTKNSAQNRGGYTSFSVLKPPRIANQDFIIYATRKTTSALYSIQKLLSSAGR